MRCSRVGRVCLSSCAEKSPRNTPISAPTPCFGSLEATVHLGLRPMTPAISPLTRLTPRLNVPLGRPISASTISEPVASQPRVTCPGPTFTTEEKPRLEMPPVLAAGAGVGAAVDRACAPHAPCVSLGA
jgi:hypothetical protein